MAPETEPEPIRVQIPTARLQPGDYYARVTADKPGVVVFTPLSAPFINTPMSAPTVIEDGLCHAYRGEVDLGYLGQRVGCTLRKGHAGFHVTRESDLAALVPPIDDGLCHAYSDHPHLLPGARRGVGCTLPRGHEEVHQVLSEQIELPPALCGYGAKEGPMILRGAGCKRPFGHGGSHG